MRAPYSKELGYGAEGGFEPRTRLRVRCRHDLGGQIVGGGARFNGLLPWAGAPPPRYRATASKRPTARATGALGPPPYRRDRPARTLTGSLRAATRISRCAWAG